MNKHILAVIIGVSSSLFTTTSLFSQEQLVKDINTSPSEFRPSYDYTELFCKCGDYLFFAVPGKELWRTDGTPDGTISLGDLSKGYTQGFAGYWTMACAENETLFFEANDGTHGWELWTSDGTKAGTRMVKDATPGGNENWGLFIPFGLIENTYYFLIDHNNDKLLELWKSNGTESSTVMVPDFPAFASVSKVASSDTHHFFRTTNTITQKSELWATDGTGPNTIMVQEGLFPGFPTSLGDKIMFSVYNSSDNTYSLWSSNGTAIGTTSVKDFGTQYLQRFRRFNNKLIFGVYSNTWISDGTEAGTIELTSGSADASVTIENDFYAFGYDFSTGYDRIFKTDGNAVEVFNMQGGDYGSASMAHTIPVLGNRLILQYFDESVGQELGVFNTTTKTFSLAKDINEGKNNSSPRAWATLNDKTYFLADDGIHGAEIWSTDGTSEGTSLLKDIVSETGNAFRSIYYSAIEVVVSERKLQLLVEPASGKSAIYNSDGTEEGTAPKVELDAYSATLFGKVNDDLIYFNDRKIYRTNGATDEFLLVKDLTNDVNSLGYSNTPYYSLGDKLIFRFGTYGGNIVNGMEFWVTDGTEEGTQILKDINPGIGDGASHEASILGAKLIFQGNQPGSGSELWITDGTTEGTQLLKDINPGSQGSNPAAFVTLGDKVIFTATEGIYGSELWITDGTSEGTMLLADLVPGSTGSEARHLRVGDNLVFFSAYDSERGWTLWKTNGTATGTEMIVDIIPGNDRDKYPNNLNVVGDKFFFGANDGVHGQELWVTDGTEAGTHVIDVVGGAQGSIPTWVVDVKGVAYFKADASLWRTNGTQQGTFKVSNLEPFNLTLLDDWIYFTGFHPDYGIELFKAPFTKLDQQIILEAISIKTFGDSPFDIAASATSGLPVVITSSDELTIIDKTATIVKPGTVAITINQDGDALFNAAEVVGQTFCVLPVKPTITVSGLNTGSPVLTSSADTGNQWSGPNGQIPGANDKTLSLIEGGSYKVQTTVDGCISEFSDEEFIVITGIENPEHFVTLYPNPTTAQFKIQATGYREDIVVDILNLQGKPLDGFKIHPGQFVDYSLQGYPSGVYLIKVVTSQGVVYQKIVKE